MAEFRRALRVLEADSSSGRLSDVDWRKHLKTFMRCMALYIRSGEEWPEYSLPWDLDVHVWHTLLLDTQNYEALCRAAHQRYNHSYTKAPPFAVPHDPLRGVENDTSVTDKRRANLATDYLRAFSKPLTGIFDSSTATTASRSKQLADRTFIQFRIKTLGNTVVPMVADADAPCEDFMRYVAILFGLPQCDMRFVYQGFNLDDSRTCHDYGITNNSTVHVLFTMKGC